MQSPRTFLLFLSFIAIAFLPILSEPLRGSTILGGWLMAGLIAYLFWQISKPASLFIGLAISYATTMYNLPWVFLPNFGEPTINSFGSVIAGHLLFMLSICLPVLLLDIELTIISAFFWLAPINAIVMIFNWLWLPSNGYINNASGMLNNSSMDASFLVALLPLVLISRADTKQGYIRRGIYVAVIFTAIVLSKSMTALTLAGVYIFLLYRAKAASSALTAIIAMFSFSGLALARSGALWSKLTTGTGRFHIWQLAWRFLMDHKGWILGSGPGTFFIYGPALQLQEKLANKEVVQSLDGFVWLHNDWFQVFFEYGLPGFILILIFAGLTYKRATGPLKMSLILIYIMALTQFPTHLFLSALYCAALTKAIYTLPETATEL